MTKVRGFALLEGKKIGDIRKIKIKGLKYSFFDNLSKDKKKISCLGLFVYGNVQKSTKSTELINKVRTSFNLSKLEFGKIAKGYYKPIKKIYCDVSVQREDNVMELLKGKENNLSGNYIGIRAGAPYKIVNIKSIAKIIGNEIKARNIYLRGVELGNNKKPRICLEFITGLNAKKALSK